jgi:hypothetical protein
MAVDDMGSMLNIITVMVTRARSRFRVLLITILL